MLHTHSARECVCYSPIVSASVYATLLLLHTEYSAIRPSGIGNNYIIKLTWCHGVLNMSTAAYLVFKFQLAYIVFCCMFIG